MAAGGDTVWVLRIDTRNEDFTTTHTTELDARRALHDYVLEWWGDLDGRLPLADEHLAGNPPGDPDEAIEVYFDAMGGDESWSITETAVS